MSCSSHYFDEMKILEPLLCKLGGQNNKRVVPGSGQEGLHQGKLTFQVKTFRQKQITVVNESFCTGRDGRRSRGPASSKPPPTPESACGVCPVAVLMITHANLRSVGSPSR